ncbi:MAG: hypothetical protein HQL24_08850 [Candidatus Omnitrophica bacterium]|nr:hypothetical protein [Candidatus Omnitrophota bacterium]
MNENKIIIDTLKPFLPTVKNWIIDYVKEHSLESKTVSEFGFSRLLQYFPKTILDTARVVIIDKVKMIPLSQLGIPWFGDFESMDAIGVTYMNTYFVNKNYVNQESIHFHELVHIVQWYHLGIDAFVLLYGLGLKKHGYQRSPLEFQAYSLQERFETSENNFDVPMQIIPSLDNLVMEIV